MKFKNFLGILYREFIYGGHFVALTAPAVIVTIIILMEEKIIWELPFIGYLLVFLNYRYNYQEGIKADSLTNPIRTSYLEKGKKYSQGLILIASLLLLAIVFYFINMQTALFSIFLATMGFFYTYKFRLFTKKIVGFKNFYTAAAWASLAILVGFYYSSFNWGLLILFLFIFFKGIFNTIFFDIKDIDSDKNNGLKTIPTIIGKKGTLKLLYILNFLSLLPIIIGVYFSFLPTIALILLLFYFYDLYYLKLINGSDINTQNFSYIIADVEFLLWPLVLLISKATISIF